MNERKLWSEQSFPADYSAERGWTLRPCQKHFHICDQVFLNGCHDKRTEQNPNATYLIVEPQRSGDNAEGDGDRLKPDGDHSKGDADRVKPGDD
jgi:hypothetical protein